MKEADCYSFDLKLCEAFASLNDLSFVEWLMNVAP